MVANGAQPTSVTESWMPVFSTKACKASENALVKIPMTIPIPVNAMASFKPPSKAFENLTPINIANMVKRIIIIGAEPRLIRGWKIKFANFMITSIIVNSSSLCSTSWIPELL